MWLIGSSLWVGTHHHDLWHTEISGLLSPGEVPAPPLWGCGGTARKFRCWYRLTAVNFGFCTSSGWAAESSHHHGMGCPVLCVSSTELPWAAPSQPFFPGCCGLQHLDCLKVIKAGELHSWNSFSHCLVVLGNQALQKAVLHFFRCLHLSAVTELLKAH